MLHFVYVNPLEISIIICPGTIWQSRDIVIHITCFFIISHFMWYTVQIAQHLSEHTSTYLVNNYFCRDADHFLITIPPFSL